MTEIHRLLQRQLKKYDITIDNLPNQLENWVEFIAHINKKYHENDQDRYLLERSIDISSQEMRENNAKLEFAQDLAKMGYWHYNADTGVVTWSKGLFKILGLEPGGHTPDYPEFLEMVHSDDKNKLINLVDKALKDKVNYDYELRVLSKNNHYRWFRTISRVSADKNEISGILMDINKKKKIEAEVQELNYKLVSTARHAGMSEVATSILHNVGNILNSLNVSSTILKNNMSGMCHQKLLAIKTILEDNKDNLSDYLSNDPKGKLTLPYLEALAANIKEEYEKNIKEADSLEKNVNFIKEIISRQQSLSGGSNLIEKISVAEIIDDAVKSVILEQYQINVQISIDTNISTFETDKSKLFQILTNLLSNAKDSVLLNNVSQTKVIIVSANNIDGSDISIKVADNGVGIRKDDLNRIFSFGFTTKKQGHGFGLHCSAIYARDLGGHLFAESNGPGKGSQFVLDIPLNQHKTSSREP
ncbi:ATP-binding protein [Legionella sp. W05-934-2]|uniref:ATP-binding protein n=1 Tax=Legionella sp. W05-934-2 TaxID=1198649 RepID=UPI00346353B4